MSATSIIVTETILDHIKDDHSWHLWGHTSLHLPVILYTSKGLEFFSSSKFLDEHHAPAIYKGNFDYKIVEGKTKIVNTAGEVDKEASKQVYGKKGESCRTCSSIIKSEVLGGRATFWCSHCQK